ncbi:MAG TPA: shikimate dehydrogenase [Methanomicrobiales archaeon]|nr:shikimate dehydrogenase [Methanomicrobiales archaeon]
MRVVLTGFRGTGKTTVGQLLAGRLRIPFIDTDTAIEERTGKRIPAIFREKGETGFRKLERSAIASLPADNVIVSAGGGAVLDPENVADLRRGSLVFLLRAGEETITGRIGGSDRPSLTGRPPAEEVGELLRARRPAYLRAADICISTEGKSPRGVTEEIARVLAEGPTSLLSREAGQRFTGRLPLLGRDRATLSSILRGGGMGKAGICGIAGYPCSHSRSPGLWNALFTRYGLPYFYLCLEWPDIGEIVRAARDLGIRGLSVTIPFKERVMDLLDEIDGDARAIGAVNTVVQCGGVLHGYNTDWLGIRAPLGDLRGARAAVLGAGGAAAAAVFALRSLDMEVTVLARMPEKAERLAKRFGCHAGPISSFREIRPDLVVNATPVGMLPDRSSLLSGDDLDKGMTVFDLVYAPPETPLLALAREKGCRVIPGTEMFIHQAVEQFFHVTGIRVPEALVRELV